MKNNRWYRLEFSKKDSTYVDEEILLGTQAEAYDKARMLLEDEAIDDVIVISVSDDRESWEEDNQISRVRE